MDDKYTISAEKSKLDIDIIHDYLCNKSYWAKGRSMESVKKSIDNSLCFGLYHENKKMIGFARVVTDKIAFAYLLDVFVLEPYRGKGLGKRLVKYIIEHPDLKIRFWLLGTADAHELYKKLGFSELKDPSRFLTVVDKSIY